jgi:hypothetical protein
MDRIRRNRLVHRHFDITVRGKRPVSEDRQVIRERRAASLREAATKLSSVLINVLGDLRPLAGFIDSLLVIDDFE